jgi:two-component system, chemotaxis family, sensor kinase CheA
MMASGSAAVAPELNEIARRLGDLAAGDVRALGLLRPALHRVVVAPNYTGAVKTLLVQALLLLDDPRIIDGVNGAPLLQKVRKLVTAALAADAHGSQAAIAPHATAFKPDALLPPDADRGLLAEFVVESREQLQIGESALLVLDSDPDDSGALDALFRAIHSIKGTSAFLGIEHITALAHHTEELLTRVRFEHLACTGELSNLVFRSIDMLDAMLVAIERVAEGDLATLPDGYRDLLAAVRQDPSSGPTSNANGRRNSGQIKRLLSGDLTVRIRAVDLDRLTSVARELVLAQSMLARDASFHGNPDLARKTAFAERLAFELEDIASELRTVSFASTLKKLTRLARDAAYQSGKSIELELEGDDVLIERVMADALADPLIHMVRNAIDHGIETPDERACAGKPAAGHLRIAAVRAGSDLLIEITDDGRGLDARRLVDVAVERGLMSADARPTEHEAFALVFRPGFSTASAVTEMSGRGVGMDVVRTNVDAIGGRIEIASRLGQGTTFTIRLPYRSRTAPESQHTWRDSERSIDLFQ